MYTADPSAHVWQDGRLYVYASHDIVPPRGCDLMDEYHVFSTDDMIHWKDHGEILRAADVPWGKPLRNDAKLMWAPDCAYKNGTYYFYFPHPSEEPSGRNWKIGVATSKYPDRDFTVKGYIPDIPPMIDPCVFVDDDGQAYLFYGGGARCMMGKLKDNMMEIDGELQTVEGLGDFHEASWIHKRNGIYYLSYSDNHDEGNDREGVKGDNRMRYATSNSIYGPWVNKGVYMNPTDSYTNHGSIVEYKGQWYAFYHNSRLSADNGAFNDWTRSVCVDKLYYNPDGSIQLVNQTLPPTKYAFDGSISRDVLENYLDRAVTAGYFLVPGTPENYEFPYREDDIRMLKNIGAKFIGRAIYRWSEESKLGDPEFLAYAKNLIERMHKYDPEIIFQGCLFEHVSPDVNNLKIPAWVFRAFNQPVEDRNFRVEDMIKRVAGGETLMASRGGGSPIVNNLETKYWFYFLAKSYIDIGCEAFHLGQVGIIGRDDPDKTHYAEILKKIRDYAQKNARRHYVLLDAHTPSGGFIKDGISLLDFNSFPLRIKEVVDKPLEGILEVGNSDGLYLRSKGAISPSGWKAESMPYLVEFDNFGVSRDKMGVANLNDHFCWGYDDITWFAIQTEDYRNQWLHYANDWLKKTDPNGHLQMCVIRMISGPTAPATLRSYFANTKSEKCPVGFSQEETIKQIWKENKPR
ncbi:hypothetical protein FACS189440_06350 [Bacteroidia bacterium]|nr:hypothetical protein FACS189440_06350 [Bacteroidia bacterium]